MRSCPLVVRVASVVFVFAVIPAVPASARTQEGDGHREVRGTLVGTVQLSPDVVKYPSRVQVTVDGADYHQTTTTTPAGNFLFLDVPRGDYVVEVRSQGFDTTRTEIRDWSGNSDVNVPLGRAESDHTAPSDSPTVSVRTLKVPEKAMKLAAHGQQESDRQHFEKAIAWLQKAVEVSPDFVEAWNNMGVTYMRMGNTKEAEAAFLKALSTDSKAVPALRNLGFLYLRTERPQEALSVLRRARDARGEKDLYIETYLGHALYGIGQYQEAESFLKEALQLKSDFPAALYPLALAQVQLHQYADARQTFTRFLQFTGTGAEFDVARSVLTRLQQMSGGEERKTAEYQKQESDARSPKSE